MTSTDTATRNDPTLTRAAIGLAVATVVAWIIPVVLDHDGAGWLVFPVLGLATAVVAWRAGGKSPKNRPAFVAFLIGLLAIVVFVAFVIFD
jgi:4-hydroxybenzoate polyprenyltransferase